jgi:hypothetical protein
MCNVFEVWLMIVKLVPPGTQVTDEQPLPVNVKVLSDPTHVPPFTLITDCAEVVNAKNATSAQAATHLCNTIESLRKTS